MLRGSEVDDLFYCSAVQTIIKYLKLKAEILSHLRRVATTNQQAVGLYYDIAVLTVS